MEKQDRIPWGGITPTWKAYKETGDPKLKKKIVDYYIPMINRLATNRLNGNGISVQTYITNGVRAVDRAIEDFIVERKGRKVLSRRFTSYVSEKIRFSLTTTEIDKVRELKLSPPGVPGVPEYFSKGLKTDFY